MPRNSKSFKHLEPQVALHYFRLSSSQSEVIVQPSWPWENREEQRYLVESSLNQLEQIDFILMIVLMSAGTGNPAMKTLTFLCSSCNLIEFFFSPLLCTCFKRSRHCYFSFTCAPRFFNHTSITKQTNKFRAYAADTNIDMSYEIQRGQGRLWTLIRNICTGQDAQPEHPSTKSCCLLLHTCICWPVSCWQRGGGGGEMAGGGLGAARNKMIIINCLSAECMIYEAKVGPVEVSHWISRGICLAVLAACCTLGSDVCITLLTLCFPLQHPAPPPTASSCFKYSTPLIALLSSAIHLHICFSLRPACLWRLEHIKRWHKQSLTLALNTTLRWLKRERREL